jgi:hypothetical protein
MTQEHPAENGLPAGRAMGSHHSHRAGTTTWLTPPHIIEALGPFDLDPCGAPGWDTADETYVLPTDGLAQPWRGMVWLNPPYGSEAWAWLDRLAEHGSGIALIFARTETAGFVEQVWNKADGVLFLHGRLYFHYPDGTRAAVNSGAPSCLVAYGREAARRLSRCDLPGSYVSAWRPGQTRVTPPAKCPNADLHETFAGMECGRCGTVVPVAPHRCPDCSAPHIDGVFGESTTPPIEGAS